MTNNIYYWTDKIELMDDEILTFGLADYVPSIDMASG